MFCSSYPCKVNCLNAGVLPQGLEFSSVAAATNSILAPDARPVGIVSEIPFESKGVPVTGVVLATVGAGAVSASNTVPAVVAALGGGGADVDRALHAIADAARLVRTIALRI